MGGRRFHWIRIAAWPVQGRINQAPRDVAAILELWYQDRTGGARRTERTRRKDDAKTKGQAGKSWRQKRNFFVVNVTIRYILWSRIYWKKQQKSVLHHHREPRSNMSAWTLDEQRHPLISPALYRVKIWNYESAWYHKLVHEWANFEIRRWYPGDWNDGSRWAPSWGGSRTRRWIALGTRGGKTSQTLGKDDPQRYLRWHTSGENGRRSGVPHSKARPETNPNRYLTKDIWNFLISRHSLWVV